MIRLTTAALLAAGLASAAEAQDNAPPSPPTLTLAGEAAKDGIFSFDYGVPTSPALALAGLSQDKATVQSAALKPFVLSLPSVLTGTGGQSAALDMSPAWLFEGEAERSYRYYTKQEHWAYRLLYRTRINAAIYNGTNDKVDAKKQKGSRLALGLSASLLDSSDPLMTGSGGDRPSVWRQCLEGQEPAIGALMRYETPAQAGFYSLSELAEQLLGAAREARNGMRPDQRLVGRAEQVLGSTLTLQGLGDEEAYARLLEAGQAVAEKSKVADSENRRALQAETVRLGIDKALATCADRANNAALHAATLSVGGGLLWRGDPGELDHFKRGGGAFWASFRFPLGFAMAPDSKVLRYLMLGVYARRGLGEFVATGDDAVPEMRANSWDYWVGLEHLTQRSKFAVQYGRTRVDATDPTNDRFSKHRSRYLISASLPLLGKDAGLWVGAAYGNARSTVSAESDRTFLITLEFAPPKAADIFKLKG